MGNPKKPMTAKLIVNAMYHHLRAPIIVAFAISKNEPISILAVLYILVLCRNKPQSKDPTSPHDMLINPDLSACSCVYP